MKSRVLVAAMIIFMILSGATMVYAEELTVEPVDLELQEYLRTQLRDKLNITDAARLQKQDRYSMRDMEQICFNDIEGHWGREQIRLAYYWGLANGFPDGSFSPNSHTTGTQSVLMIRHLVGCFDALEYQEAAGPAIDWELVPTWALDAMQEKTTEQIALMSRNYGKENISRLHFALMLAKSLKIEKMDYDQAGEYYLDQDEMTADDLGYVLALREMGLISGSGGRFYPEREITRAEVVVILNRVIALAEEEAPERIEPEEKKDSG